MVLSRGGAAAPQLAGRTVAALGLALILAATFAIYGQYRDAAPRAGLGPWGARTRLNEAADRIAALLGPALSPANARLAIETTPLSSINNGNIDTGPMALRVAYMLRVHGWTPAMVSPYRRAQLDPVYSSRPGDPILGVTTGLVPTDGQLLRRVVYPPATLFSALFSGFPENLLTAQVAVWARPPGSPTDSSGGASTNSAM
jgi:hypothetical protein